jgi:hypothetical protein
MTLPINDVPDYALPWLEDFAKEAIETLKRKK